MRVCELGCKPFPSNGEVFPLGCKMFIIHYNYLRDEYVRAVVRVFECCRYVRVVEKEIEHKQNVDSEKEAMSNKHLANKTNVTY